MHFSISKQVLLLSVAFLILFTGFNGVQQFITTFFSQIGLSSIGFQSLILIYLFFTASDPFSAIFVTKYGAKRSMACGALFYGFFIFMLATHMLVLIYLASMLLGFGASLLWTGQTSYLSRVTNEENRGRHAGFFGTLLFLGSALGVITFGFIINKLGYTLSFLLAGLLPLISFILLFFLEDVRLTEPVNHIRLLKKAVTSKTAWQLGTIWFTVNFVYGLAIGIIPIDIKHMLGIQYVGSLSSLFYLLPMMLTFILGKLSDVKGRRSLLLFATAVCFVGLIFLFISRSPMMLISGIVLIAVYNSMMYPTTLALTGDVSTKQNVEYISAFFWMVQNLGIVCSLLIATFIQSNILYIIALLTLLGGFFVVLPMLLSGFVSIKQKLSYQIS